MMLPQRWRSDTLVSARAHEPPCADGRDIVVPPHVPHRLSAAVTDANASTAAGAADGGANANARFRCQLFFAGAARAEQKAARSSWCDDGESGGVRCYSQVIMSIC